MGYFLTIDYLCIDKNGSKRIVLVGSLSYIGGVAIFVCIVFFSKLQYVCSMICVFADLFSSSFRPVYDGAFLFRVGTPYHNSGISGLVCDALPLRV